MTSADRLLTRQVAWNRRGEGGKLNISGITYQLVKDEFMSTYQGNIKVKTIAKMEMYFASPSHNQN